MPRTAVVAGASGLVGGLLLADLLRSPDYSRVTALVRRPLPLEHPKLSQVVVDFSALKLQAAELAADDAFCCLGTTRAKAGSPEAFSRVDFDAVVSFARQAREAGAKQFLLVSSTGADARSRFLYPRVKGQAEEAVARLPFAAVHLFRPSFLIGHRTESRPLERALLAALAPLRPLFFGPLSRYRPIEAAVVARAMLRVALHGANGGNVFENEEIAGARL